MSNGATLINNNPRIFLSMDGWVSYGLALACFVSLSTRRPLVYLLIRSLLDNTPLRIKHKTDEWDDLWEREPWFRRPWRVSTMVWGLLNIVTGSIRLGIAFIAPVDLAPMLLGIMTLEIVVVTQVWQTWYLRRCFKKRGGFVPADRRRRHRRSSTTFLGRWALPARHNVPGAIAETLCGPSVRWAHKGVLRACAERFSHSTKERRGNTG